jgi:hypothetical protein
MALRIDIHAPLSPGRGSEDVFAEIQSALESVVTDPILRAGMVLERDEAALLAYVHPGADPLLFGVSEDQVTCSITTSAGPGFHAWVVETLEALDRATSLRWNWQSAPNEDPPGGDETGYREGRDFAWLQQGAAKWLAELAAELTAPDGPMLHVPVCMPVAAAVEGNYFACSPLGFVTRDWFVELAQADDASRAARAAAFFPWWNRELDAVFYKNYALSSMWCHIAWRRPAGDEADDAQCRAVQTAMASLEKARQLDPAIEFPPEAAQLPALLIPLADDELEQPPPAGGIGYLRRRAYRPLPGGWQILMPGYFRSAWNIDAGQIAFYFGERSVQVATFSHPHAAPHCYKAFGDVDGTTSDSERLEYEKDHLKGTAALTYLKDHDDDPGCWTLQARMIAPFQMARITITFANEADGKWADETWRTLYCGQRKAGRRTWKRD